MVKFRFRLIYVPDRAMFELTFGKEQWYLTQHEVEQMIINAKKQLVDTTDAMVSFTLKTPHLTIDLHGVTSREAFKQMVGYLDKVWSSFKQSRWSE